GFARAKPIEVIMYRHHLRLWKAPFELNSRAVWLGAATHDIGLEGDERDGSITHKIDPKVDNERDFVAETFRASGTASAMTLVLPNHPDRKSTRLNSSHVAISY